MSSPAGPHFSQADFIARWMPSSTRAGVILNPCPDLAGSLRRSSAVGSPSLEPDDSFASDFAPLAASADSSYLGVDGFSRSAGGERAGADRPVNGLASVPPRDSDGELVSLKRMAHETQDLPLVMKLEQLRKWQQHMQEQLKAHQLEELLHLQEEQQRLLGTRNGSQDCTGGEWSPTNDEQEESVDTSHFHEHDDTLIPNDGGTLTDEKSGKEEDRPIGGQKKTFEQLLEEQLRLEEQRLKSARQQQSQDGAGVPPKRAFLRRGQGLSRFTNRKASMPNLEQKNEPKPQLQARAISRSNSEPAAMQRSSVHGIQRFPVQRKTAILNKENRLKGVSSPPQDIRVETKVTRTKVLGSHQRPNTAGSESTQSETEGRQSKRSPRNMAPSAPASRNQDYHAQPQPVIKHIGVVRAQQKAGGDGAAGERRGFREESAAAAAGGGGGVRQDSFEQSFQEKLRRWESERQVESMELGEFELLEQAAEELSFSSNSSFVLKVLQMDQLKAGVGVHPRRLSSTPIKSPPPRVSLQRSSSEGLGCSSVNSGTAEDKETQDHERDDRRKDSDLSSGGLSDFEDQEVRPPSFPSALCFPAQCNPPYDKRSYQDQDGFRASPSDVTGGDDGESESVLSDAGGSTLTEDRVVFDDDDTWNDLEDAAAAAGDDSQEVFNAAAAGLKSPPERTLLRKVAPSKAVEQDTGSAGQEPDPPPTPPPASQLMTRLFPALKPKAQNATLPPLPAAPESHTAEVETGQQVQSRLLRERLVQLEIEIERFKKENAALTRLRQENEKREETLRKERLEFEQVKAQELAKFEEYKKEENRKLQKERKVFEQHVAAARAIPDKKEREEIQALRQQLSSVQAELSRRESRWTSTNSRLRQQLDSMSRDNAGLQDEIRVLEKLRLSAWKKNLTEAERSKDVKDGPRIPENLVTKGVKFATPLDSRDSDNSSPPQSGARRGSREHGQGAAGIKSSLRRPAASGSSSSASSSSSLPGRKMEERPAPGSDSPDKPAHQDSSVESSPNRDCVLTEHEHSESEEAGQIEEVITHPDGKIEKVLAGGDRLVIFPNGTRKEVSADGQTAKVTFFNGDTKQVTADQRVIYYYTEAQTTHITYPDGMEVLHFPNNQTEKHFPDGRKEITFPDQTVKNLFPSGREESVLTDGTIIQVNPDGTKEILFNTGQKEIHTADYKRREYPDGTVKTVYSDGRQETRYPTGRLRIKDKDGNIVADNRT
ncbi:uncharacterized protein V6R79_015268 [Siganus canaliculatus]